MKAKNKLFSMVSNLVMAAGVNVGVKSACMGLMYQPKAPKHLSGK